MLLKSLSRYLAARVHHEGLDNPILRSGCVEMLSKDLLLWELDKLCETFGAVGDIAKNFVHLYQDLLIEIMDRNNLDEITDLPHWYGLMALRDSQDSIPNEVDLQFDTTIFRGKDEAIFFQHFTCNQQPERDIFRGSCDPAPMTV